MSELRLDFSWEDPGLARAKKLRTTWARLKISIDDKVITSLIDRSVRSWREDVILPLYPLAEWLAANWWALWNETETTSRHERDFFSSRHALRQAREGFALPDLTIVPTGQWVQLSWAAEDLHHQRVRFTETSSAWLPKTATKEKLADFVTQVIARLEQQNVQGTRLQEDWQAIRSQGTEEDEFCILAGALGLDPYSLEDSQADQIMAVAEQIPTAQREEFFHAADPDPGGLDKDLEFMRRARLTIEHKHKRLDQLVELKQSASSWSFSAQDPPWVQGYALARKVHEAFAQAALSATGSELLQTHLGVDLNDPDVVNPLAWAPTSGLVGYVGLNASGSAGFVLRQGSRPSQTFRLSRAPGQYLWPDGSSEGLVTLAGSDQQKRNRAFAAEFLAPSHVLREHISGSRVSAEDLDTLAQKFQVASQLIRLQLDNHAIATAEEE